MDTLRMVLMVCAGFATVAALGLLSVAVWSFLGRRRSRTEEVSQPLTGLPEPKLARVVPDENTHQSADAVWQPVRAQQRQDVSAPVYTPPVVDEPVLTRRTPATPSDTAGLIASVTSELAMQQEDVLNRMEEIATDPDLIFEIYRLRQLNARVSFESESLLAREDILLESDEGTQKASHVVRRAMQSSASVENIRLDVHSDSALIGTICRPLRLLVGELLESLALSHRFGRVRLTVDVVAGTPTITARAQGALFGDAEFRSLSAALERRQHRAGEDSGLDAAASAGMLARRIGAHLSLTRTSATGYEYVVMLPAGFVDQSYVEPVAMQPTTAALATSLPPQADQSRPQQSSWASLSSTAKSFTGSVASAAGAAGASNRPVVTTPPLYEEVLARFNRERQQATPAFGTDDPLPFNQGAAAASEDPLYVDLRQFMQKTRSAGSPTGTTSSQGARPPVGYAEEG